jgi:hypothetical protein
MPNQRLGSVGSRAKMGQSRRADDLNAVGRSVQGRLQHGFQRAAAGHEAYRASRLRSGGKRVRHERVAQQRMFGYGERNGAFRRVQ